MIALGIPVTNPDRNENSGPKLPFLSAKLRRNVFFMVSTKPNCTETWAPTPMNGKSIPL